MSDEVIVLGAGIVGLSVACQLRKRGREVLLIDRSAEPRATSYGNAGLIQTECTRPYAFPRDLPTLWRVASNRSPQARWDLRAMPRLAPDLLRYWWHSAPRRYEAIAADYARLIDLAGPAHEEMLDAAGCRRLVEKRGWIKFYRSADAMRKGAADAKGREAAGIRHRVLDDAELYALEPSLTAKTAGAIHWIDAWSVTDPAALLAAYRDHFRSIGGRFAEGDATTLAAEGRGWTVATQDGPVSAPHVVIALGPWSRAVVGRLGHRVPLFLKRGYHRHFSGEVGAALGHPLSDVENGYVLAPMAGIIRLTAGVEFAREGAPADHRVIERAEAAARGVFPLGDPIDADPWLGARPCLPDMKPVIGPSSRHPGLWFAFGHGHQGLTLGPATGRLLAAMMCGEPLPVDPTPFTPDRFG